jgi:hypothetical protein
MSRASRFAFAAAVCLVLAAPPCWAAGPRALPSAPDFTTRLWSLITSLWSDAGCIADPNGGCANQQAEPPAVQLDEGCIIDPHGVCGSQQVEQVDEGCIADPNGGCKPRS